MTEKLTPLLTQYLAVFGLLGINLFTFLLQNILFRGSDALVYVLALQQLILVSQMVSLLLIDQYVVEYKKLPEIEKPAIPFTIGISFLTLIPLYYLLFYYNLEKIGLNENLSLANGSVLLSLLVLFQAFGLLLSQIAHAEGRISLSYIANYPTAFGLLAGTAGYYYTGQQVILICLALGTSAIFTIIISHQYRIAIGKFNARFLLRLIYQSVYVRGAHNIHNIATPLFVTNYAAISKDQLEILNSKRIIDMIINGLLTVYTKRLLLDYLEVKNKKLSNYKLPKLYYALLTIILILSLLVGAIMMINSNQDLSLIIGLACLISAFSIQIISELRYTTINIVNGNIRYIYIANLTYLVILLASFHFDIYNITLFWGTLACGQFAIFKVNRFGAIKNYG